MSRKNSLSSADIDRDEQHRTNRGEKIPSFKEWLFTNGAMLDGADIEQFSGYGYGLKATKDLNELDSIAIVPKRLIISSENARKSPIGKGNYTQPTGFFDFKKAHYRFYFLFTPRVSHRKRSYAKSNGEYCARLLPYVRIV